MIRKKAKKSYDQNYKYVNIGNEVLLFAFSSYDLNHCVAPEMNSY